MTDRRSAMCPKETRCGVCAVAFMRSWQVAG
jgi:hypothetical protein